MEEIITRELAKKLMEIKGETRGVSFQADGEFILKEKGEEGLNRLEEKMAEVGCPIKYKEVKPMDFFPLGFRGVELLVIKELFNFDKEKIKEMGVFQTKISLIVKLFMQYFGSVNMLAKQAPKMWRKYYTVGDLTIPEMSDENRYGIIKVENFALHPIHCQLLEGYFANIIKMVVNSPVECEETKCTFRGDDYHEFAVKW